MRSLRFIASPASLGLAMALISNCSPPDEPIQTSGPETPAPAVVAAHPVIAAVGDLVCSKGKKTPTTCQHASVATLIGQLDPDLLLLLGDIQYEEATLTDFNRFYQPTWGKFKAITRPSAGNHEYETPGAAGYYDYFNGVGKQSGLAGHRARGYYSFDIGEWHVVALNSNCDWVGGCEKGSRQERWLRADLAANPTKCTLAYWHHPRFSSGWNGNYPSMEAIWQALYDHHADLVLTGHDHVYERFAPQTATGAFDRNRGLRSFVVGTGGKSLSTFATRQRNSVLRSNAAFGVLKLTLQPTSYRWEFVPAPGYSLSDVGGAACNKGAT